MSELFTLAEVKRLAGGKFLRPTGPHGEGSTAIRSVTIDSRTAGPGALFVPCRGPHRRPRVSHRRPGARRGGGARRTPARGAPWLAVLERGVRTRGEPRSCGGPAPRGPAGPGPLSPGRLPAVTRVGVTGSNGKTTTKEIIGAILSRAAPTAVSGGNLNSEIGLPLACFQVGAAHRWAVFEMGMNRPGEMDVAGGHRPARPGADHQHRHRAHRAAGLARGRSPARRRGSFRASTVARPASCPRASASSGCWPRACGGASWSLRAEEHPGVRGKREPGTGWNAHPLGGVPGPLPPRSGRTTSPTPSARRPWRASWASGASAVGAEGLEAVRAPVRPFADPARRGPPCSWTATTPTPTRWNGRSLGSSEAAAWPGRKIAVLGGMRELGQATDSGASPHRGGGGARGLRLRVPVRRGDVPAPRGAAPRWGLGFRASGTRIRRPARPLPQPAHPERPGRDQGLARPRAGAPPARPRE